MGQAGRGVVVVQLAKANQKFLHICVSPLHICTSKASPLSSTEMLFVHCIFPYTLTLTGDFLLKQLGWLSIQKRT